MFNKKIINTIISFSLIGIMFSGCGKTDITTQSTAEASTESVIVIGDSHSDVISTNTNETNKDDTNNNRPISENISEDNNEVKPDKEEKNDSSEVININTSYEVPSINNNILTYKGINYNIIEVDGGNMSGHREANVAVDVGFGDRVYWGLTNEYGQLIHVIADTVILQDDNTEPVTSQGRYYSDEASVPGTENKNLDKGHVIADSLGGVSNAYNITPQNSTLNRHGDQAYMEKEIRNAGGCSKFLATITYPNTQTMTPSHYHFEYILKGNLIIDDFDNINPEDTLTDKKTTTTKTTSTSSVKKPSNETEEKAEVDKIDLNHNGIITIQEATDAGIPMPVTKDDWIYKYMVDGNNDGIIGQ